MGIRLLFQGGVAAWLASLAFSGACWQFFNPFVLPFMFALGMLQAGIAERACSARAARRNIYLLDVIAGASFLLAIRSWTVGPLLIAVGYACNQATVLANGLVMPAICNEGSIFRSVIGPQTRLRWLCDIFTSERGTVWFSVGDVLVVIGVWVFAAELWLH